MSRYHVWSLIWAVWFVVTFGSFLIIEIYGLATDWNRTLSASIWRLEKFQQGQPIDRWTAAHFLFIGVFLVLVVWLLGHFAFGWWRD